MNRKVDVCVMPSPTANRSFKRKVIALERRLAQCRNVETLGVKTNFSDYDEQAARRIREADKVYYPTTFYAELFDAMGKETFPSYHTYKCVQDKIKQSALFDMLRIPHPKTRVFYGRRRQQTICDHFSFPFIAKIPRGSALGRGVYLIRNMTDLIAYSEMTTASYIQEYLPSDRDIRVVIIGKTVAHAYWRVARPGEFRSNLAKGGTVALDPVPSEALDLALHTARSCRWDDVGIDILPYNGTFYVLEANMKYGKEGFRQAGIDYVQLMENLIENGDI